MVQQAEIDQLPVRPAAGQDTTGRNLGEPDSGPLNSVDILSGKPTRSPTDHLDQNKTQGIVAAQDQPPIGTAQLMRDESLLLRLEAETADGQTHGDAEILVRPTDTDYSAIKKHIGEIHQGQIKFVSPWNDAPAQGGTQGRNNSPIQSDMAPELGTAGGDTPNTTEDGKNITAPDGAQAGNKDTTADATQSGNKDKLPDGTDQTKAKSPTVSDATTPGKTASPDPVVPASQAFDTMVSDTYNAMSSQTKAIISKKGAQVVPVHHLTDALPELKGQTPRGWPAGSTWDSVDGCWSSSRNEIVVSEERKQLTTSQWVQSGRTPQVLRHEAGHAVDYTINMMSDHQDFENAYDADVQAMSAADKKTLAYFLQSGTGGRQETAAEGVADREGGATGGATFHNDFPKTIKVINDTLNSTSLSPPGNPATSPANP